MHPDQEWNRIRSKAARRLPADFAAATVRLAGRRRRAAARMRAALGTAAVLFLAVNAGHGLRLLAGRTQADALPAPEAAEWARQRIGIDL